MNEDNPYDVLGVSKDATDAEIKAAFKKKAHESHPDKNLDKPEARETFQKVSGAYALLTDQSRRKKYDGGVDSDYNDEHAEQLRTLAALIFKIIDDPQFDHMKVDLIGTARNMISNGIVKQEEECDDRLRKIDKRERVLRRIVRTNGENQLAQFIRADIETRTKALEFAREQIKVGCDLLEALDGYEYLVDVMPQFSMMVTMR